MKTLVMILSPFIAMSAMASVNLTRTSNNGTVAPQFQTSTICMISENAVSIKTTGANSRFAFPLEKQAVYTNDVPNEAVLESLANEVLLNNINTVIHPGPIGGGIQSDSINLNNTSVLMEAKSGNVVVRENDCAATLKLEAFLNKNCN